MATATPTKPRMTGKEFFELPDDPHVERVLIKGVLKEYPLPMPYRNRHHSRATSLVTTELELWLRTQPVPRGQVLNGDAGVRFDPDADADGFGIDVVYVSAAVMARQSDETSTVILGVPELVVEVLSPSDTPERMNEKIDACLDAGVPLVWVLDPHWRTVTVYRPGSDPELVAGRADLTAPDVLPGFQVAVADLFGSAAP